MFSFLIVIVFTNVFFISCKKDKIESIPAKIEFVNDTGEPLVGNIRSDIPIKVMIYDQEGNPYEGADVNFSVDEGNIGSSTKSSNSEGIAGNVWTLGITVGTQTLRISAFQADGITHLEGSPMNIEITVNEYEIGGYFEGGIIFYVNQAEGYGLICSVADASLSADWGCDDVEIAGADGTEIGTGSQNTADIVAGCVSPGIAADVCINYQYQGYNDWFLPSKDELNEMYIHKTVIDESSLLMGGAPFADFHYWSSSEHTAGVCWKQNFGTGLIYTYAKWTTSHVRPVRIFNFQN
jgi:hypothetical protein